MAYIKTDKPGMIRDTHSKAILFTDNQARQEYLDRMSEKQKIQNEINTVRKEVDQLKTAVCAEISELKNILLRVITEKGNS